MMHDPFTTDITSIPDENDDGQTELISLQTDNGFKVKFETSSHTEFWFSLQNSYPLLYNMAQRELLPFATTNSCETAFSAMLHINTKFRNRLDVGDDIRCCLTSTQPRITELVKKLQHQASH